MKPRIYLAVKRPDGRCSNIKCDGAAVTSAMIDAAEDLAHTLSTGERVLPKDIADLYDLCARAFATTRIDAKERLVAAAYGKRGKMTS